MIGLQAEADCFIAHVKGLGQEEARAAYQALSKQVQRYVDATRKAELFKAVDMTAPPGRVEMSESGKYRLEIRTVSTSGWNYMQGDVFCGDTHIATVQRNFRSFPFLFVEGHAKGDFLVCGADYQGQTVIELGSGQRRDTLRGDPGFGFCWSSYSYVPAMQALLVNGCFWAAPYETRVYDFADPLQGWPWLEPDDPDGIDCDERDPTVDPDGTLRTYQTRYVEDEDEDGNDVLGPIVAWTRWKREGAALVKVETWISDDEVERRRLGAERRAEWEAKIAKFRADDPLYLEFKAQVADPLWIQTSWGESFGVTYENWCPTWTEKETRCCRRLQNRYGEAKRTIDLEWAITSGPIKVCTFEAGAKKPDTFFPHSVEGMRAAFGFARDFLS